MSRPEWISVLKLAMLWQMENIQKLAVKQILELSATIEEWTETMKTSPMRDVPEIRQRALRELQNLAPVERILLGRECRISEWLLSGYKELVEGDENISREVERRLGGEATMSLFRLSTQYWGTHSRRNMFWGSDMNYALEREFRKELEDAGNPNLKPDIEAVW
jgi:hypothetical protein